MLTVDGREVGWVHTPGTQGYCTGLITGWGADAPQRTATQQIEMKVEKGLSNKFKKLKN